jgi:hypothetical protein
MVGVPSKRSCPLMKMLVQNKKQTFNKKEKEKETRSISGKRRELDVRNCQR